MNILVVKQFIHIQILFSSNNISILDLILKVSYLNMN